MKPYSLGTSVSCFNLFIKLSYKVENAYRGFITLVYNTLNYVTLLYICRLKYQIIHLVKELKY